jgi:hypothetical protein
MPDSPHVGDSSSPPLRKDLTAQQLLEASKDLIITIRQIIDSLEKMKERLDQQVKSEKTE